MLFGTYGATARGHWSGSQEQGAAPSVSLRAPTGKPYKAGHQGQGTHVYFMNNFRE